MFFLMIRRPPRSTLFPTRRSSDLVGQDRRVPHWRLAPGVQAGGGGPPAAMGADGRDSRRGAELDRLARDVRSEEHTSELQSRQYLVCRLLLEKKKKHTRDNINNRI